MQRAGSASWQFTEGIEEMPLVALFVRDAVGLAVLAGSAIPPRLGGERPGDRSDVLEIGQGDAAGPAWTDWWLQIVSLTVHHWQDESAASDQQARMRQRAAEYRKVFDPPAFASLANSPALREAVRATFEDAVRWANTRRRALRMPPQGRPGQFDYDIVRGVAEQMARQYQVSPGAVRGCALVLPVEAKWWARFAPGAVLCSIDAARDPAVAQIVLTDAFESSLAN